MHIIKLIRKKCNLQEKLKQMKTWKNNFFPSSMKKLDSISPTYKIPNM